MSGVIGRITKCPTDAPAAFESRHSICFQVWFNPWKDVAVPGYIDAARIAAMSYHSKPSEERGFLAVFHGGHPGAHGEYKRLKANIRTAIVTELQGIYDVSVGGAVPDFFERMGRSHFCLIPRGSSAVMAAIRNSSTCRTSWQSGLT